MPQRSLLVADDIENKTGSGQRRSQAEWNAATFLAQRLKAGIDLLYVEDVKTYPHDELMSPRFPKCHSRHEERLREIGGQFTVPVSCSVRSGHPAEQILKAVRSRPAPELVVVGTQGRKGVKRLLIGSVAEEVIRHSRRPVMVIGPIAQEREWPGAGQKQLKILVPTDLGKNSRTAEQYALSLAMRFGARVTLFHCLWDGIHAIIVNAAFSGTAVYNLDTICDEARDDARESMKSKAAFFQKHGVTCEYKVEEKTITSPDAVYQEAEGGYSLIVMGTHGRNTILEAFFGSTARETILHAAIPVITVHSGR
jgi:nucleotide-binding universal stress UspA family protein